ncbi:MAG: nicotinate (nicotinamide) nucleotide adenylyltransferase [Pigmentiphaga sp.]|nr:nicotinate (nicotinamide) nucleotide adenylyltransferase [Pigmentiphaga sp.]
MGVAESPLVRRRLGLLGGSFDPVHHAHLELARAAHQQLALDQVLWLPARRPWQRSPLGAAAEHRLAMLRLALANEPGMTILTLELERAGPTYTADTLAELGAGDDPSTEYVWFLGSDQLRNFCTWERWPEIVRRVRLAVARRPEHDVLPPLELAERLEAQGSPLLTIEFPPLAISATEIRRRVAAGQPIEACTPPAVADYIHQHQLYRSSPTA